ncbi:MAG TPA: bifunctional chorismate mutase/prephenate dehydrogenase [Phycisphaerales bacterium]|nr:bifunctional chorismate mutase/prephenate dehydrogenase [Phycisphaerales bacterium]
MRGADDPNPVPRELAALRGDIDSIDHELVALVARRAAVVAKIAGWKRRNAFPIRDPNREQEVISGGRARALALGVQPGVAENLLRLLLASSRDQQARLRTEIAPDVEPRTVAVIGGKGAMGRCMAGVFADLGHRVIIADLDTEVTPQDAASRADVVVLSVPIDATEETARQLGPLVRDEALLMDVASVKEGPLRAMLESTRASVVGTHPLFGPSVHSVQGQRVVLTPGRGDAWLAWLKRNLTARGLIVRESSPREHDAAMGIVQVLTHFSTEVMGRALTLLGASVERTLEFTSPVYLMELLMTARHFAQSPELYASIQMTNPRTPEVTRAFVQAAEELQGVVQRKDRAAFRAMFEQIRAGFGGFEDSALERSSDLIDRLVERL